jgi:hypothetical protein
MNNQAGKGDKPRPVNKSAFNKNFDEIRGLGSMTGKATKTVKGKTTYVYKS